MQFTKFAFSILDKTIKSKNRSYFKLKEAYTRAEVYNCTAELTNRQKAKQCWFRCKGNCFSFRTGINNNNTCKLCKQIHCYIED